MVSYLTQQDVADYGSDLIDLTQRAAAHALSPQIEQLAQENHRLQHWLGVEARHRMDREVEAAVPNFREIDQDPRWHAWLSSRDSLSGQVRQTLLNDAIASGSVHRVVSFFKQFQNQAAAQTLFTGPPRPASRLTPDRRSRHSTKHIAEVPMPDVKQSGPGSMPTLSRQRGKDVSTLPHILPSNAQRNRCINIDPAT